MYYDKICGVIGWLKQRTFLFFAVVHAVLFLAVFASLDYLVGGNGYELGFVTKILDGMLPFSDFTSEYPPLALFSFLVPALFSSTQPLYGIFFAIEIYLLDLVILFILFKLATRLKLKIWPVLGIYTLCLVAIGPIVTGRFDLLPATLVLVALYAFISGRNKTAWGFLALGAAAKLYPLVIVPLFALFMLRNRQYRRLAQGITIFGGVILALNLPFVIIDADGFWQFLSYHFERGLHSESSYGSVLLVGQMMGLMQLEADLTYGSWNVISSLADALAKYSFYITSAFLLSVYCLYARWLWQKPKDEGGGVVLNNGAIRQLLLFSLLAIFIMLLTSKVFSPQFLIWLCPLIPLVIQRRLYNPLLLFLVAAGISQYIYPHHYQEFEYATLGPECGYQYLIVLLFIRNLLILAITIQVFAVAFRSPPMKGVTPSGTT